MRPGRVPALLFAVGVCATSLVAGVARADDVAGAPPAEEVAPPRADVASAPARAETPAAPTPADDSPTGRFTAEGGGGQSRPSPTVSSTTFFYERIVGRYAPTHALELGATLRATEDLAPPQSAGSAFRSTGDAVFYGAFDATIALSAHVDLDLGINGSPPSTRNLATTVHVGDAATGTDVDALVRARSGSVGALAEVGYDTFDDAVEHDVDVALETSVALTRFSTTQEVLQTSGSAPVIAPASAELVQARVGVSGTLTFAERTNLGLDVAYFVYDAKSPGDVGLFDATSGGLTTSFGAGIPMLPPRWTLRPEIGHRVGVVTLGAYYQFADLAIDSAVGHTVGTKVQVAIGRVKLYATGSYRSDVFTDSAAQTWVAGLGLTGKL